MNLSEVVFSIEDCRGEVGCFNGGSGKSRSLIKCSSLKLDITIYDCSNEIYIFVEYNSPETDVFKKMGTLKGCGAIEACRRKLSISLHLGAYEFRGIF